MSSDELLQQRTRSVRERSGGSTDGVDPALAVRGDHVDYPFPLVARPASSSAAAKRLWWVAAARSGCFRRAGDRLGSLAEALVRDETLDQPQAYAEAAVTAPSDEVPAA